MEIPQDLRSYYWVSVDFSPTETAFKEIKRRISERKQKMSRSTKIMFYTKEQRNKFCISKKGREYTHVKANHSH